MGIVHVGVGHYIVSFQRLKKKNLLLEDNLARTSPKSLTILQC